MNERSSPFETNNLETRNVEICSECRFVEHSVYVYIDVCFRGEFRKDYVEACEIGCLMLVELNFDVVLVSFSVC